MVQIPPNIQVKQSSGQDAAAYLQTAVNQYAAQGWEFYRVDTIGVMVSPGCLGALLGAKQSYIEHYVITFRRPKQS